MRRPLWIAAAAALAVLSFWAGLVAHFPGEAFSRYLEGQVNRDPRVSVRVSPAEMGWTMLSIPQIRVDGAFMSDPVFLLALTDTEIPLSLALWGGLPLRTRLGTAGEISLYWPWAAGEASFTASDLRLENIPALAHLPAKRVQGGAELSGQLQVKAQGLPEGQVRGRLLGVEIGGAEVLEQAIERTRLDEVRFQFAVGPQVRIESFDLQGDLQGSISGTIAPNLSRPDQSNLDLQVTLGFRSEWIQQLGSLAPVAESLLDGGKLSGTLRGTPARPAFRNAKSRP